LFTERKKALRADRNPDEKEREHFSVKTRGGKVFTPQEGGDKEGKIYVPSRLGIKRRG